MTFPTPEFWRGRDVFVTGHTGFKGAWLCLWLSWMGARIHGYALPEETGPEGETALFRLGGVKDILAAHHEADIRDRERIFRACRDSDATVLFHLAAQPLVRESYRIPYETFEVNCMGTAACLEALRRAGRPAAAVLVTTDKCYDNPETVWGRRETDPLGGHDPYSASKAAAELVAAAWRESFFPAASGIRIATVRAGNVIGGGDWAADRLIPDLVRACKAGRSALVRNPRSVRPWQHVLDPLAGYLVLAERLLTDAENPQWSSAWNFGPMTGDFWEAGRLADEFCAAWGSGAVWKKAAEANAPFESAFLSLCVDKASRELGWRPRWDTDEAVRKTAAWYRAWAESAHADMGRISREQLEDYCHG